MLTPSTMRRRSCARPPHLRSDMVSLNGSNIHPCQKGMGCYEQYISRLDPNLVRDDDTHCLAFTLISFANLFGAS